LDQENPVWSSDGRYLAVFGPGRFTDSRGLTRSGKRTAVLVYEIAPATPTYVVPSAVQALTFSPDGRRLAAQDGVWEVIEERGRRRLRSVPAPALTDAYFKHFFTSGGRQWASKGLHEEIPPGEPVKLRQVYPDSREIVLAGVERTEVGHIGSLAVSPDASLLLLGWQRHVPEANDPRSYHIEGQLELWDLVAPKRLTIWEQSEPGFSLDWPLLQFSPDGKYAVTQSRSVGIWDVATGKKLHDVELITKTGPGHSYSHSVKRAVFNASGKVLVTVADQGRFDLIEVRTGRLLTTWRIPEERASAPASPPDTKMPPGEWSALALHPDGSTIALGGEDHTIRLWDSATGQERARWEAHDTLITALVFSPDGKVLVSGGADGTLKLWDLPMIRKELAALGLDW
jgi:WD40 repeat protein